MSVNGNGSRVMDEESPLLVNGTPNSSAHHNGAISSTAMEEETGTEDVPLAEQPSNPKLVLIMGSIWLGVFLAALDGTVIATLVAPISTSFNSLSLLSWLASAYLIANAALQPLSGRLTDIYSRRTGLVVSNILFGIGTLTCGLAHDEWVMIAGRVVAGMGGGGLTAISTFVASDLVPLRRRGLWQGFGNICFGAGAGVGGVFGGWVNDVWGWRAAFLIQVPFIVVSGILVFFVVNIPVRDTGNSSLRRIDYLGAVTLIVALVLFLLALSAGGNFVPWNHPLVLVSLPLSFIFLLIFVYVEDKVAPEPVIPVRLLLHRTVASACLTNWFGTMGLYALLFYGPIYFQLQGLSTTQAGLRLMPSSIGAGLGSIGAGLIMNITGRYYLLNMLTAIVFVTACALICTFSLTTPWWPPFLYLFLAGAGYAGMLTVTLLALIGAVEHSEQAVATSASYAFRSTGSTIGITVASAVFQNILNTNLWKRFGDRRDAAEIIGRLKESFDEIKRVPPSWSQGVLNSYMEALKGVFATILIFSIAGGGASLFMREHKLHKNLARS